MGSRRETAERWIAPPFPSLGHTPWKRLRVIYSALASDAMKTFLPVVLGAALLLLAPVSTSQAAAAVTDTLACDLAPLTDIPAVWALTPEKLEQLYPAPQGASRNPFFTWLTADHSRALFMRHRFTNLTIDLTILDKSVPVEEATVDFVGGKLNGISFSIYNRGDSGTVELSELHRRSAKCNEALRRMLGVVPAPRHADPAQGLLAEGWTWISQQGMACLETNPELEKGKAEYMRMRLAPRDARGAIAASMRERRGGSTLTELAGAVKRNPAGDVWIEGVPMVDQGPKGYCVVASAQRLFEYFGISCDEHQLAQLAGSQAQGGTNSADMMKALQSIDGSFKTQFKPLMLLYMDHSLRDPRTQKRMEEKEFLKLITEYTGKGIPLLWGLELGRYPEEPPLKIQGTGGHMRLIIGCNAKTGQLIFTDSWGPGHELKRMKLADAFAETHGLFAMQPTTH